ncbi:alpha/beta hydrolase [soil metagenome]
MAVKSDVEKLVQPGVASFPESALTDTAVAASYLARARATRPRPEAEHVEHVEQVTLDGGLALRIYRPGGSGPFPTIVFFHGGGWVLGDLEMHDSTCRKLANGVQAVVVNVDYRLAPEHPFPAGLDDCFGATKWASENIQEYGGDPSRLVVAGTSAGGNLAVAVALKSLHEPSFTLALQVLIYPVIDSDMSTESYREYAVGYSLEHKQMKWFLSQYVPDESLRTDPLVSPWHAPSLAGLPSAIIVTAECDPLRDEAERFASRLKAEGVAAELTRYDGQIHGFMGLFGIVHDADIAIERLCSEIRDHVYHDG